ncbi:hypothetical protein HU751_006885 [Pseudomonas sp. BW13M1]|uniref:Uncharacterized protein n=1 Tax=Pseudomonas peradeniyensis TaxID=2745488 RepID=A0A923G6N2_9PSED|nr:hypothetical protein [Pseudomonas peradeniyensis]MBV4504570.1 hypothetical protein [Pseudomonas peradeniyensis]
MEFVGAGAATKALVEVTIRATDFNGERLEGVDSYDATGKATFCILIDSDT